MEESSKYIIPFRSMADGRHDLEFKIDKAFFEAIEDSLIGDGDLVAKVEMTKSKEMLKLHFDINGVVRVPCDVCLDMFDYPVEDCEGDMVVKFGETTEEIDDELFQLAETENEFSVAQWIYEIIAVSLPIRFVHPEDENGNSTCNKEMLDQLSKYLVNEEKDSDGGSVEKTDPRWDALKGLLDKN